MSDKGVVKNSREKLEPQKNYEVSIIEPDVEGFGCSQYNTKEKPILKERGKSHE